MIKPQFSFCYDGKEISSKELSFKSGSDGSVAVIDDTLSVRLTVKEMPKHNATEWVLYFENNGKEDSKIISNINDCDMVYYASAPITVPGYRPEKKNLSLVRMNGMVENPYYANNDRVCATEYALINEYFMKDTVFSYHNRGGRSSDEYMPFFHINDGGKKGMFLMIGWSGSWNASFTEKDGNIQIKSGLMNAEFYVKPGESLRTTATTVLQYEGESENLVRRLIADEYSPEAYKHPGAHGFYSFELWGGLKSEEMVRRLKQLRDKGITYDQLWVDAGWYGNCTNCEDCFVGDWNSYTGDYTVNLNVHPDRFADVVAESKKNNMDFMLWFDPEHATHAVPVSKEHPEWMLGWKNEVYKPYNLINYGNGEAWNYIFDMLCSYIEEMDIKVYRQDFNADPEAFFAWNDEKDRAGVSEIKHITGMYRLWDSLLEKYPYLLIDNCASGGRRCDLETLKRATMICSTDYMCLYNENADVLQTHMANFATYFPHMGSMFSFVDRSPTRYTARSSYNESWGVTYYGMISQSLSEKDYDIIKETNAEYCAVRDYFSKDYYNHGSSDFDSTAWAIWQYHDPEKNKGIIMAFRRENSPFAEANITLKGVDDGASIEYRSLDNGSVMQGDKAVTLKLPEKESALILEYTVLI